MKRTFYFVACLFCSFSNAYGLIVGSDTAVSRNQSTPQFPDVDTDNEVRGFVAMDSGFSLEGGATTCTYNAFFPVSGAVTLNGGSLYLQQDLIFSNTFSMPTVGKIYGNNHTIHFPSGMTEASFLGGGGGKILNFITQDDPTAGGLQNVASVDWSASGSYLAVGMDNLGVPHHELRIYYFDGSSLTLTASFFDTGTVNVNSVRWHPTDNFLAVGANVPFASGNQDFNIFKFDPSTGIFVRTHLIGGRPLRAMAWSPNGDYLVTGSNVGATTQSEVQIYSFSTATGRAAFVDQYVIAGEAMDVNNSAIGWGPSGNPYFAVGFSKGDTTIDAELCVYHFDGTTLTLTYSVAVNSNVKHVDWSPSGSFIAVGLAAGSTERLRVYTHRPPIGAQPGIVYEETTARVGLAKTVRKVHWGNDGTKLAVGTNSGAGAELEVYDFDATTTTFSLNTSNVVETGVSVDAVRLDRNNDYLATGDFNGFVKIYSFASTFLFENVFLFFDSDINFKSTISFQGGCKINMQRNRLKFSDQGTLEVKPGALLTLDASHLELQNSFPFSVKSDGTLKIKDSNVSMLSNIIFSDGALEIEGDVDLSGNFTFNYQSEFTSTITAHSTLFVKGGARFSLGRSSTLAQQPLEFIDNSSVLRFDSSTLAITGTGVQFTKGKIIVDLASVFDIENTQTQFGLILGDGIEANDIDVRIKIATSDIDLKNGALVYNNFATGGIGYEGGFGSLTLRDGSLFFVERPWTISSGTLVYDNVDTFSIAAGSYLTADNAILKTGTVELRLTGTITDGSSILLDQNDEVSFKEGQADFAITVSRENNLVGGSARYTGTIYLVDENSTVTYLNPTLIHQDISLNGGVFNILRDLGFAADKHLLTTGTFIVGSHNVSLANFEHVEDAELWISGEGGSIVLPSNLQLKNTWTIDGSLVIDGAGNKFEIKRNLGNLVINNDSDLLLKNMILDGLALQNVRCVDDSGTLRLRDCILDLHGTFTFMKGMIEAQGEVDFQRGNFLYESSMTSTIKGDSTLKFSRGIIFSVGRYGDLDSNNPFKFLTESSKLELDGATLKITSSGMSLLDGVLIVKNASNIDVANTWTRYGLVLGDGTSDNDFTIDIQGGGQLHLREGVLRYEDTVSNGILFSNQFGDLDISSGAFLSLGANLTLEGGSFDVDRVSSILFDDNVTLRENSIVHDAGDHINRHNTYQDSSGLYLRNGGYFRFSEGRHTKPDVFVRESGARIDGGGVIISRVVLQDSSITFSLAMSSVLGNDVVLNGGKIALEDDLRFAAGYSITGSGEIDCWGRKVSFGARDLTFTESLVWTGITNLELNGGMTLATSFTFNGITNINGNGNIIDFDVGGGIYVGPGGTLYLTDIVLKDLGVMSNQLGLLDDTAEIRMSNVTIELDGNVTNTIGGIIVEGPTTWALKNHNWTLDLDSSLTVDGVTLWIDPLDKINPGKIIFGTLEANHLSLLNSGTIKTAVNWDIIRTDTSLLGQLVEGNSNTILVMREIVEGNSYAILSNSQKIRNNSNAISALGLVGDLSQDGSIQENANLRLLSDVNLTTTLSFAGTSTLNGLGQVLDLTKGGTLLVNSNSELTIADILIKGVSSSNIACLDDTGKISLNNVMLALDSDFTFSRGALRFKNSVEIMGNHKFIYQSSMTSTIYSDSELVLSKGVTFSYDPLNTLAKNLISFEDASAIWAHNDSIVHTTTVGMELTKGQVLTNNNVIFESEVTTSVSVTDDGDEIFTTTREVDEGITFGDGVIANDATLTILGGSVLRINSGSLIYKNVDTTSFNMLSDASILRVGSGAALRLHEDLDIAKGIVEFEATSTLKRKSGKDISGSVSLLGPITLKYF